jgi:hypothetical protein
MDGVRLANMIDRIAGKDDDSALGGPKDPVEVIDEAVDNILASIEAIGEALGKVEAETAAEKAALVKIQDLMETAIAPYMIDVVKAMDVFVGKED